MAALRPGIHHVAINHRQGEAVRLSTVVGHSAAGHRAAGQLRAASRADVQQGGSQHAAGHLHDHCSRSHEVAICSATELVAHASRRRRS